MSNYRNKWFENNDSNYGWYTCVRCGKKLRKGDVDIDHIIPQNYNGGNNLNNLQCMCKSCNRSKQDDIGFDTVNDYTKNVVNNASKNISSIFKNLFNK
ncbi:HNH endonuclease [Clostridium tyrobutyricum]|uniref:HNH endonuclease n=1 Tax=Clostridium tyrobutyricum TaxID=1519 RepID=UPI00241D63EE|nr:HNH endonuclease signature motif containing protein [Clostridium tyrobutyricum]